MKGNGRGHRRDDVRAELADIGKLAAIAAIRTALNFFLDRDMENLRERGREQRHATAEEAGAAIDWAGPCGIFERPRRGKP